MKKVVIVAIIALFFSGLLFPSRNLGRKKVITINNPIQSSVWKTGFSYTIRWSLPGDTSLLSISLIPQQNRATGLMITPITAKTNNDGNYLWKIPGTIKSGKYIIRISTLNGKIFGNSKGFEIRKKMHAASHELSKIIFMKVLKFLL